MIALYANDLRDVLVDGANSWQRLFTQKFVVMYYYKEIIKYSSYSRKRKFINRRIDMQIEPKIMSQVKSILGEFGNKYLTSKGSLKRNNVINDLDKFDHVLMTKLFKDPLIHKNYVEKIADAEVFKLNQFVEMFEYKNFWEDSYTKFTNKIGLTANGKFIDESADVVLDFPFKDTVLKAGMTKEDLDKDESADEPLLNEIIAKPEIDELLEPKIFVNATKYDQENLDGAPVDNFEDNNLIIKGNNLIALHSLKQQYAGKVKLIYLDVPYNTGNDSFGYNDKFNHSAWLTFLKNRLEISYELLSDSGSIFVQLDDHEVKYLGVLLDEIFGRDNFVELITIVNNPRGRDYGGIANMHEFLFAYKKSPNTVLNPIVDSQKKFPYKDKFGPYEIRELRNRNTAFNSDNRPNLFYPIFADPNSADENNFYEVSEIESEQFSIEILPKKSSGIQTVWRWGKAKLSDNKGKNVVARPMKDGCPAKEKYLTVQALSKKVNPDTNQVYGISVMCQYVGVSRAAYYKWLHRKVNAHELENEAILAHIIKREESKNYIFGVRTMTTYINEETPYHVSEGRVRRIMRRNGIQSSIRAAKHDRKQEKKDHIYANKLLNEDGSHDFKPEQPNMTWVTDCSELKFGPDQKQRLRVSAIKDLCDRSIIAWE